MKDFSKLSFKDFIRFAKPDLELQPYQKEFVDKIDGANKSGQEIVLYHPRNRRTLRDIYRQYEQEICSHEWSDNVLLVTPCPAHITLVTACLICMKVKEK